jgi:branched-chain amino acid transport system permease protein
MSSVRSFFSAVGDRYRALPRWARVLLVVALAVLVYLLPILNPPFITTQDSDFGAVLFLCALYALVAIGLNIVIGYAGLLDLGYIGFFAVGAYTVGVLGSQHAKLPLLLCIPLAMVVTLISGVILGAPTLRVRGDYLAIVTLGFGEIVRLILVNGDTLTNGSRGISNIPTPPSLVLFEVPKLSWNGLVATVDLDNTSKAFEFSVTDSVPYYWLALTFVLIVLFLDWRMQNSRVGRAWEATREDEDAAELMGVPTFRFKLLAFATGAAIGGLSGALFAGQVGFVNNQKFDVVTSVLFLCAVILGGSGNKLGVIVGGALVSYIPNRFTSIADYKYLIFGVALVLLMIFRSQGLIGARAHLLLFARTARMRTLELLHARRREPVTTEEAAS